MPKKSFSNKIVNALSKSDHARTSAEEFFVVSKKKAELGRRSKSLKNMRQIARGQEESSESTKKSKRRSSSSSKKHGYLSDGGGQSVKSTFSDSTSTTDRRMSTGTLSEELRMMDDSQRTTSSVASNADKKNRRLNRKIASVLGPTAGSHEGRRRQRSQSVGAGYIIATSEEDISVSGHDSWNCDFELFD